MAHAHLPRRRFLGQALGAGFALTPLAALLAGCTKNAWPEGMAEIKWDRDTCTRCKMVISDRRFAAEVRGGPKDEVFKFDDIGCVAHWLKAQDWGNGAAVRLWVADAGRPGSEVSWLDARKAQYVGGKASPMGYNFAAYAQPQAGSQDFETMREHVLLKTK